MPRRTVFKPPQRPNLSKDPLWKEVFLSDSESEEEHEKIIKEINMSVQKSKLDNTDLMSVADSDIKNVSKISNLAKIETKRNASAHL